jgi:hypothetical protein
MQYQHQEQQKSSTAAVATAVAVTAVATTAVAAVTTAATVATKAVYTIMSYLAHPQHHPRGTGHSAPSSCPPRSPQSPCAHCRPGQSPFPAHTANRTQHNTQYITHNTRYRTVINRTRTKQSWGNIRCDCDAMSRQKLPAWHMCMHV